MTFDRPYIGDGIGTEDFALANGDDVPVIWAHGPVISGAIQSHTTNSDTARGTFEMNLVYIAPNKGASWIASSLAVLVAVMSVLLA